MIYCLFITFCYFSQNNLFTGASAGPPKLSEDNNDRMRAGLLSKVSELLIYYMPVHVQCNTTQSKNTIRAFKFSLSLLFQVIDHISLLVEDWFTGVRPRFLVVPCPHCSHALPPHPVKLLRSHSINPELRPSNVEAQQHVSSNNLKG